MLPESLRFLGFFFLVECGYYWSFLVNSFIISNFENCLDFLGVFLKKGLRLFNWGYSILLSESGFPLNRTGHHWGFKGL